MSRIVWQFFVYWKLRFQSRWLKRQRRRLNARLLARGLEPIRLSDEEFEKLNALRVRAGMKPMHSKMLEDWHD